MSRPVVPVGEQQPGEADFQTVAQLDEALGSVEPDPDSGGNPRVAARIRIPVMQLVG